MLKLSELTVGQVVYVEPDVDTDWENVEGLNTSVVILRAEDGKLCHVWLDGSIVHQKYRNGYDLFASFIVDPTNLYLTQQEANLAAAEHEEVYASKCLKVAKLLRENT